uniref:Cardiomyopathy-associated protein 5 n=1 Tax=Anas zonorhyncha TaxID=75864 RepID=A0A8B9ZSE1_9AVES
MNNPSFSMVTVQSEDSGITWETSSSRCSTPWTSETSTTSDLYSMESSPVGSPPGKVIFIMDEGKIVRKRKRKPSNRVPLPTTLKGGQGNKKRDSSGMQRQEPRTVLGDVQGSVLNVEQMETRDTDEEMLDDKEDLENIAEEPVKRAPIRSIFRESRLRKVGPILGGPVKARIQLFNSIFGGTGPAPETLEKTRIQRKSSVSGDSEQFLDTSVKERLHQFSSFSEATHPKPFQRIYRNLETPSERRRNQRQQSATYPSQSYSSATHLEKQRTNKDDISLKNIKPTKMKDTPSKFSSSAEKTTLQHKERTDRQSLLETPDEVPGQSVKSCPPEEARKQQSFSYSPVAKMAITEQSTSIALESDDKSEKQVLIPSAETAKKKTEQSLLTASDLLDEPKEQKTQASSAPQPDSADRQSTEPILPTASASEHPEKEIQKSAVQSYLPSAPSAKFRYSTLSDTRQEDIIPQSSESAQSESEHVLLPHSVDETEKQETESHSSATAQSKTDLSGPLDSVKKMESQRTPIPEMQNVHLQKQTESEQDFSTQITEDEGVKLKSHIPEKIDSKYLGISYAVRTEKQETQKSSVENKAVDMDHPVVSTEVNNQAESAQMEMENPDISYSSEEMLESESVKLETEHPGFSYSKDDTEELESAQLEMEQPDISISREETEEMESAQHKTEHPNFSYSREEMEESECAQLEMEQPDISISREETEEMESAQHKTEHPNFSYSREEMEESECAQLEMEQPDSSLSKEDTEEPESAQHKMEHPDFSYSQEEIVESESEQQEDEQPYISYSREETEELESAQLETEQPDISLSKEDTEESESAQHKTDHPGLSYSQEEMLESESTQLETEYPGLSYAREEMVESGSAQLEMEQPDFSFSREETEELENVQYKMEQPDFSYSREETVGSESAQLEHPDFSFSREDTEELESAQLEMEQPGFSFSSEETEELENAQHKMEQPDFSYSREEMVESGSAQLEHPDLSFSREETEESESAQLETEHQDFSFYKEETERPKPVPIELEHPESYYAEEAEQETTAKLELEPSDLSCLRGEAEKENTTEFDSVHPDIYDSTGGAEKQQMGHLKKGHSDLPYPMDKTKHQALAQVDLDSSLSSHFGDKREQLQPVQQDSQLGGKLYSLGKAVQGETTQLAQSEHPIVSYSTTKEQQHKTSQLRTEGADTSYSTDKTEQELLQPRLKHADVPYSQGEAALEAVHKDLEGPGWPSSIREGEQNENVLPSENRDLSFTTGEIVQEGIDSGSLYSSCSIDRPNSGEMAQLEQKDLFPSYSTSDSKQQGTSPLGLAQSDTSYSFGKMEQEETEHRELEELEEAQPKATQMELQHSDLSETWGKADSQDIDQMDLAQQETAQPELACPLPYTFSEQMQEEMQMKPAYPEQAFYVSTGMQEEVTQCKSKQPLLSCFTGKMEQDEVTHPEPEQTLLPSSSGKESPLEMEVSSEYPDLSYSSHRPKQQEKFKHPTLPFSSKQQETAPLVMEHPDFSCTTAEVKSYDAIQQDSEHPEKLHSMGEMQQESEYLDSPETLSGAQDEAMEVESKYTNLSRSVGEEKQQETLQLDSKHPDTSLSFGESAEQSTQEFESKCKDLPKVARKRALPGIAQIDTKHPGLTYSLSEVEKPEIAQSEVRQTDLSHFTNEANKPEAILLDQKHRKISVDREKHQQTPKQQLQQEKLSYSPGNIEQLKCAQEDLEQSGVSFPTDRPVDKMTLPGTEHTDVIHPLDKSEVQLESEQVGLIYSLGKPEQKMVQSEVDISHLAHSVGQRECSVEQEETAEPGQGHPDLLYSVFKEGELKTTELKPEHPGLSCSLSKVEEITQLEVEQFDVLHVHDKTEQHPPAQLELGHRVLASRANKVGRRDMAHTDLVHPDEVQPVGRTEHPPPAKEKEGVPCASPDSGKEKQKGMAKPELEHPDLSYSIDKTQPEKNTQLGIGKPDLSSWPGKTERAQAAQEEQSSFFHSFKQGEKAKPELGHSQLFYSVSEAEQETPHKKSIHSDLSAGRLEHHEVIQPETEIMDLSCSVGETQQTQIAKLDLECPDLSHSTGALQQQEGVQPELEKPGDFSSSLSKGQWESAGMQAERSKLQYSVQKTEGLQNSQAESEYADLSFSVGTAEPHKAIQPELEELDLLHSTVKTKQSWAAALDPEHPNVSDAMAKVLQPDLSSSISKDKQSAQLDFKQERESHTLHPEEEARLNLEQPTLSSRTVEQPERASVVGEFLDVLHSFSKKEQQEMAKQELEHSGLSYSTDKTQRKETPQLVLGQADLSSCPGKTEQAQTVQVETEHRDLLHSPGKTQQQGTARPEVEHPGLSRSVAKVEQPQAMQWESEQTVTPHPIVKTEQHGVTHPEQELPSLPYSVCKPVSQERTKLDIGHQDLTYALGKADEIQTVRGELEHRTSRYSFGKTEQEMMLSELQHKELSYPVRETEEEATHQKSNYTDLSHSIGQKEHHGIVQPELEEMDLSYTIDRSEISQPAQIVLQQPEVLDSFGKLEEKVMAQPSILHSHGEEKQELTSQLDSMQPGVSHLLGKTEIQETAEEGFVPSDLSYSMGKADQLQREQMKLKCPELSYSLGKLETHGVKPSSLMYSYGKAEQPQAAQMEHPETPYFMGETEQKDGAHPEEQCVNLQYSVVEAEQPETPSVLYTLGRTGEQETAQPKFEQPFSTSTEQAEKHEMHVLRAGHSEKGDTGTTSSLTTQWETEQDLSFSAEEAASPKIQPYSSPTEKSVSIPLGVSHSVSKTKMERSPKSSPVAGGMSPEHLDLSHTHYKTEQSETAQPVSSFFSARKEAENTRIHPHLHMAAYSEAEHIITSEAEREQAPHYFHTTKQLESEPLNASYSTDKTETVQGQEYLTVPSKLETEPSVPFYSVDETCQQEIPPYSKPTSEYLVAKCSLAEHDRQSMLLVTPQSAQSESRYVIPPHDETELQKDQLYSPKTASLNIAQMGDKSLLHTQEQDEQNLTEYLSSEQLRSHPTFTANQDKQEIQPDVQKVPSLMSTESKVTAVADQQPISSDSFVPFHTSSEKSVSVSFTGDKEKKNISLSLSKIVGTSGNQTKKEEERHGMQPYLAEQKYTSLEQMGAVSPDLVYETVTHKIQHSSGEQDRLSSAESKSVCSNSDEKPSTGIPSFDLASWLAEEVKARSIHPIRATEVDKHGIQLSLKGTSGFGSKQFPAGSCAELTVHGTAVNKGDTFRVSDSVSSEISHRVPSETGHRMQRHDLLSPRADNPGPEKVPKSETKFGNPTEREAVQHPQVDKTSKVPEHYVTREEEEMEQASAVEDTQHEPEPTEQKDLFNIISEGYEILNIHAPTHISSVDQEESKHMPDKLEYLETNPSFKRKLAHDSCSALASGTTTEISDRSVLGKPETHEQKELVKNDETEETEETQKESPLLPESNTDVILDPDNGMADMDYFEKYTLIDDKSPVKPHFERLSSSFPETEDPNEPVEQAASFKESTEADTLEEEFSLLEDLDEVFYGTAKGESKMQAYAAAPESLPPQKSIDISSKRVTNIEDERKSPGTPLFDSEEGVLERSLFFPTSVAAVNPELLEEPPALSFLYKDLYAEAVGEKTKGETPSDEESGNSNASFPSRNSDTDDGTGIYFEKYILKDEIPGKVLDHQEDQIPEDESFSGGISVQSYEDKYKYSSTGVLGTEILPERGVVETEKVQVDSDIKATICKPMHAIPFGREAVLSGARSDTTEQREEENVPVETTEELPEQMSQEYSQIIDSQGAAHPEAGNKREEQHKVTAVPQMEKYIPYIRTPVEDSEDDQYTQENISCVPTVQQREKTDLQREEQQHPDAYEDLAESMDYDVITQEELLQDEISSEFTHEELLFEDRDSFEHVGDSYEFVNEPEQRTPVELEDSGFVVMYPEKSMANIPQVESPQRELKKAQTDTYCYHCKCPISAIDKLFGEHKDHEVTTLDDAATKMKDQLGELLKALEEKSMKIEEFVSDIESLFNSVEENCKKNAELLEKQNEEMLKKVVAQYDEKSENFEEVKKMKMEYLYEQMVNYQQTVDSAKETLETTVKEMEELDGFVFLNSHRHRV